MILTSMTPQHYQRDFDDLGSPELMMGLKERSGYVRPRLSSSTLDILSATSYSDQSPNAPTVQSRSRESALGYVLEDDEMSEPRSIAVRKKAKVANRASTSPDRSRRETTTSKRQRGRPKLDSTDETTADRRRTQIRLAQRAYRQRKETTIASLKDKVLELQQITEQMNTTFGQLHDSVINSGLLTASPATDLRQQLQASTEIYQKLIKAASADWDQDEDDENIQNRHERRTSSSSGSSKVSNGGEALETDISSLFPDITDFDINMEDGQYPTNLASGQSITPQIAPVETTLTTSVKMDGLNDEAETSSGVDMLNLTPADSFISNHHYTYSFQETTFARRLHRRAFEVGVIYLTDPAIHPELVKRAFRFTFTFSNRDRILARFHSLLRQKAGENLENWNLPFFPIGGAGTHFPPRDQAGNMVYPPNMLDPIRAFGPYRPRSDAETPINTTNLKETLEAIGYDGIWYDCHDVEQYLKTKGLFLNATSSYAAVDAKILQSIYSGNQHNTRRAPRPTPSMVASQSAPSLVSSNIRRSENSMQSFGQSNFVGSAQQQLQHQPEASTSSDFIGLGMNQDEMWTTSGTNAQGWLYPEAVSEQMLIFDVERFLSRLVYKARCLGRAPGFRKEDVDEALRYALQEMF